MMKNMLRFQKEMLANFQAALPVWEGQPSISMQAKSNAVGNGQNSRFPTALEKKFLQWPPCPVSMCLLHGFSPPKWDRHAVRQFPHLALSFVSILRPLKDNSKLSLSKLEGQFWKQSQVLSLVHKPDLLKVLLKGRLWFVSQVLFLLTLSKGLRLRHNKGKGSSWLRDKTARLRCLQRLGQSLRNRRV